MSNHGFNIASVGFCLLFISDYSDRLSKLGNFKEGSVVYDWEGCSSVEHEFDFKSTIFLAVSDEKVEGILMKTWFEVTSSALGDFRSLKERNLIGYLLHRVPDLRWIELSWVSEKMLLCGMFLWYCLSEFSGLALRLYWVCWRLFGPLFQEVLDHLFCWNCLSGFRFVFLFGLKPVCR